MKDRLMKLVNSQSTTKIAFKIKYNNEYISLNEKVVFPAASTIKIPISILNIIEYTPNVENLLTVKDRVGGTGVLHSLRDMKNISLRDAIALSIIVSDNTTSNMLIDNIGLEKMNLQMKGIGLSNTEVNRHFMDTNALGENIDNYTTACDALKFVTYIFEENEFLNKDQREDFFEVMKNQQFNDRVGGSLNFGQEAIVIASKTGTLKCLEHDVGILNKGNNSITYAIFSEGWRSNKEGKEFLNDFGDILIEYLEEEIKYE